eukprot:SAG31_NODE_1094_length_9945_cov_3.834349_8_plen_336_part_00
MAASGRRPMAIRRRRAHASSGADVHDRLPASRARRTRRVLRAASAALLCTGAAAIENGIGLKPPRGWRSWNQFDTNIHQDLIEAQYEALVDRSRQVDGVPTSLLDLGYTSAGIDDGWQQCNAGPDGVGFHDAKGRPIVDTAKFPDMKAMTQKARSIGITPGWYVNNCMCKETRPACAVVNGSDTCFDGDVAATLDFGFRSVKVRILRPVLVYALHPEFAAGAPLSATNRLVRAPRSVLEGRQLRQPKEHDALCAAVQPVGHASNARKLSQWKPVRAHSPGRRQRVLPDELFPLFWRYTAAMGEHSEQPDDDICVQRWPGRTGLLGIPRRAAAPRF